MHKKGFLAGNFLSVEEESNKLICFVCNKSDGKITLFSEEALKKCHTILELRKKHNLKYKDIILPDEYTDGGYHRECHKKYYTSEPVRSKRKNAKEQLTSVVTDNLSPVTPLISELTTNLSTESPTASEQNLFSQSTEPQPSISQEQSQLPPVLTEPSTTSQPTLISELGASTSTTNLENLDISDTDDNEHSDAPEDVDIPTENDASINNSQIVMQYMQICNIYNVRNIIDVDAARLQTFVDSYTVSDVNEAFNRKKLRNFDGSSLPPCKSELLQQFLRANYICTIWNNAHLKNQTSYGPENNGWVLENGQYHFKWFEGDQLPNYVSDSLTTLSGNDEEEDIDDDQSTDRSSSDENDENIEKSDENN